MSKLKELIEKLCPDGVIFKTLGELHSDKRSIMRGIRITKKDLIENGQYKVYGGGEDIIFGYYNKYNIKKDTVTINVAGSVGFVDYITEDSWIVDSRYAFFTNQMNLKFLYYALKNKENELRSFVKGAIPGINMDLLMKVSVPIPPIEVQREIVRILDNFTELEAELEAELAAELAARTKQYEYYKNKLLINDKFRKIKLSDIGPVKMCRRIFKNQTTDKGDIPFYKIGTFGVEADAYISRELFLEYKDKYPFPNKSDVLLSASGTIGRRVIYEGEDAYFQDSNIVWIDNDETIVLNKYLYYLYGIINWKVSSGGTISRLYNKIILNTEVLVPPLDEQERIVSILDKFSSIVNDIKEGLPAEIELRRKQYEYYRNKLLTFE